MSYYFRIVIHHHYYCYIIQFNFLTLILCSILAYLIQLWKEQMGNDCTWRANPNRSMVIGETQFSPICVGLATELGYTNPDTNTGQGNRKAGISLIANSGCGPTTLKGATRHSHLNTTAGTYHKSNMEDQLRAGLAVQGTEASQILHPPPLDGRERSKSVPASFSNPFQGPTTKDNATPLENNTIHPTSSYDTIDSKTRPTSMARQHSLSSPIINRGTSPMYSIYQPHTPRLCIRYCILLCTVCQQSMPALCIRYCIPKCLHFGARGPYLSSSFISFFLTHDLSLFCLLQLLYIRTE
jgi:hypothetical protein